MCLAIPGKVTKIVEENGIRIGQVQFGGIMQPVSLDFTPDVVVGEYVLVHVGFAISRVDAAEAERVWSMLEEMEMLAGELPVELPVETTRRVRPRRERP
jgi:hydrogenase expression/formation protein HypC